MEDLKRLASALKPRTLVPIHTFHADDYPKMFDNAVRKADGETFKI